MSTKKWTKSDNSPLTAGVCLRIIPLFAEERICLKRGIAQSGSAPALGAGCREFESLYPDQAFFNAPVAHLDRASAFKCVQISKVRR